MSRRIPFSTILLTGGAAAVAAVLVLQVLRTGGLPDPTGHTDFAARVLDIAVLVFREGLECILVLSAITANMVGPRRSFQRPVAAGAGAAFIVTLITWRIAIGLIDSLADSVPALDVQAATGLLAILVLLLVMNWFFHKIYWAGWISLHSRRKQALMQEISGVRVWWGLALLGFSSLYREGFEVVLFLQSYRLKLGGVPVLYGVLIGLALTTIVGVLTFAAHRRLPYRRMLVFTGVMLGLVLLVMVGEQAQEMQLARWLPTTPIAPLERVIPGWMGLWFAVFPTVETLAAQLLAAALVLGSFLLARPQGRQSIAA
jgi:high-affinity iron transporter